MYRLGMPSQAVVGNLLSDEGHMVQNKIKRATHVQPLTRTNCHLVHIRGIDLSSDGLVGHGFNLALPMTLFPRYVTYICKCVVATYLAIGEGYNEREMCGQLALGQRGGLCPLERDLCPAVGCTIGCWLVK